MLQMWKCMEHSILILVLALSLCSSLTASYKILVFSPHFSKSHGYFMGNIADTLVEAGHNVTMLISLMSPHVNMTGTKLANVVTIPPVQKVMEFFRNPQYVKNAWTSEFDFRTMMKSVVPVSEGFGATCRQVINHKDVLRRLREERFDLGVLELFDGCALGLLEVLKIPAHVSTSATVVLDPHAKMLGIPLFPSYVPASVSYGTDRMGYIERFINYIAVLIGSQLFEGIIDHETKIFREVYGDSFIDLREKVAQSSFVLTNGEPLLEYPRPTISKVVDISGLGIPKPKPLNEFWQFIVNKRDKIILMSSGSVAQSHNMPKTMKEIVLNAFAQFPQITFIWKYEADDLDLTNYPNVVVSKWIPQNDLLHSAPVVAFITHAGMNSVIEAATRGVPMIAIPLFAEQNRNAAMVERAGIGIKLNIFDLPKKGKLLTSISTIVSDGRYAKNARKLAKMIAKKPMNPKKLLVHHIEFAAEFGQLPNLDPFGRKMPFYKLYMLDIFVPLLVLAFTLAVSTIVVGYRIVQYCMKSIRKIKEE